MTAAYDLIAHCGCPQGCPACVGPVLENEAAQLDTKRLALALLRQLTNQPQLTSSPDTSPNANANIDVTFWR